MAEDNAIKEYLISLGFKVDEPGLKRYNDSITSLEKNTLKFATTMAGLTAGVVTGVAEVAKQFSTLYWVSERTGATVENLNAVGFAAKQIGLGASAGQNAIEGLARTLRLNGPAMAGFLNNQLGVKTAGRDTGDIFVNVAEVLKQRFGVGQGFAIAAKYWQTLGVNADDAFMIEKNLDQFKKAMETSKAAYKDAGVEQQQAAKLSADFIDKIGELGEKFKPVGDKLAIDLIPHLIDFVDWLEKGIDKIESWDKQSDGWASRLVALGGGFISVTAGVNALRGALSLLGLTSAASSTAIEGTGLWRLLVRMGLWGGVGAASIEAFTSNGFSQFVPQKKEALDTQYGITHAGGVYDELEGQSTTLAGKVWRRLTGAGKKDSISDVDYFLSKGYSQEQSLAIAGYIQAESGGDPNAMSAKDSKGRFAYGIGQWRGPRLAALVTYLKARGKNLGDREGERDFMLMELQTNKMYRGAINAGGSLDSAVLGMVGGFGLGGASPTDAMFASHLAGAQSVLGTYNKYASATGGKTLTVNVTNNVTNNGVGDNAGVTAATHKGTSRGTADVIRNMSGAQQQ